MSPRFAGSAAPRRHGSVVARHPPSRDCAYPRTHAPPVTLAVQPAVRDAVARHRRRDQRGGLVVRRDDKAVQVALIARYDRRNRLVWSPPKGHVEEGETVEQAALGSAGGDGTGGLDRRPAGVIDFWFAVEDRRIHKTVHHFLMRYDSGRHLRRGSGVVEAQWVDFEEVPARGLP